MPFAWLVDVKSIDEEADLSRVTIEEFNARVAADVATFIKKESVLLTFVIVKVGVSSLVSLSQLEIPVS